jgi:DNA-binding transcriptional LysR family regulator
MQKCMSTPRRSFDWTRARAFLATADAGSFSGAARALASTQPTVGRQVAALEEELGVALFERIGNVLSITPAGVELVEHVRAMEEAATNVSRIATGRSEALEGTVRITASELISAYLLTPAIRRLRREHPAIALDLVVSNAAQDLQRREADIAVRNFAPTEPELYVRTLPERRAGLYATPALLAALGRTGSLRTEDLAHAEFFGFVDVDPMVVYLNRLGIPVTRANFPVITDNHLVQWQLCRAGLGICIVLEEVGDADPGVQRVLPLLPTMRVPMQLTSHRDLRTSRRMRVVFDLLAVELSR